MIDIQYSGTTITSFTEILEPVNQKVEDTERVNNGMEYVDRDIVKEIYKPIPLGDHTSNGECCIIL